MTEDRRAARDESAPALTEEEKVAAAAEKAAEVAKKASEAKKAALYAALGSLLVLVVSYGGYRIVKYILYPLIGVADSTTDLVTGLGTVASRAFVWGVALVIIERVVTAGYRYITTIEEAEKEAAKAAGATGKSTDNPLGPDDTDPPDVEIAE